ncbi:MAG: hypothetical protein P8Y95_16470, partial [Gammaproteobacteria bacterium]
LAFSHPLCASPWPSSVEAEHAHPCPMEERSAVAADASCWCDPGVPCTGKLDDQDQGDHLHACVTASNFTMAALTAHGSWTSPHDRTMRRARPPLFLIYLRFLE